MEQLKVIWVVGLAPSWSACIEAIIPLQTASPSAFLVSDATHSRSGGMIVWLQLNCIRNDLNDFLLRLVTERVLLINRLMFNVSIYIGKAFQCLYRSQISPYFDACKCISNLGYYLTINSTTLIMMSREKAILQTSRNSFLETQYLTIFMLLNNLKSLGNKVNMFKTASIMHLHGVPIISGKLYLLSQSKKCAGHGSRAV